MIGDRRLERARAAYERSVFVGDRRGLDEADRDLDAVEADLALARGRLLHARFLEARAEDPRELELFEHARELSVRLGDERGEAEALLWIGIVLQVVRDDWAAALPPLERSYELAGRTGDALTASYAARHVGFAAARAGEIERGRALLEESVALRRQLGFEAGVAAGLVALAELARRTGRPEDAGALLEEADAVAGGCGADGVRRWVEEGRRQLADPD
jgi:hypothetical protein